MSAMIPPACGRRGPCRGPYLSELAALTAEPGYSGTLLSAPVRDIVADLGELGTCVAVTANTAATITRIGYYDMPQRAGAPLWLNGSATCLRLREDRLASALAVDRMCHGQLPRSMQLFSAEGAVLHKAFLSDCKSDSAFSALAERWTRSGPRERAALGSDGDDRPSAAPERVAQIDAILHDGGLTRRAALPERGKERAWRTSPSFLMDVLSRAAEIRLPLTIAIGNAGAVQLHHGALDKVRRAGAVMLASGGVSTISFDEQQIEELWIVHVDSDDGGRCVLELYDWGYQCVAQISVTQCDNPGLARFWDQLLISLPA